MFLQARKRCDACSINCNPSKLRMGLACTAGIGSWMQSSGQRKLSGGGGGRGNSLKATRQKSDPFETVKWLEKARYGGGVGAG